MTDVYIATEAFDTLIDSTNSFGSDPAETAQELVEVLMASHRTLQQETISILVNVLVKYADAPSDLRNQRSVDTCKTIRDHLYGKGLLYADKYHAPRI